MYNKIILMGRLVKDPEVKYTQTGKVTCSFSLAVERYVASANGQKEVDYIPIIVWGKIAEACGNNLAKGKRALVDGRLQIRNYAGKDGQKRYITEVVANSVHFLDYIKGQGAAPQQPAQGDFSSMGTAMPLPPDQIEINF